MYFPISFSLLLSFTNWFTLRLSAVVIIIVPPVRSYDVKELLIVSGVQVCSYEPLKEVT